MTKAFAVDLLSADNIETCLCGRFFVGMVVWLRSAGWPGQTHIDDLLLPISIISNV